MLLLTLTKYASQGREQEEQKRKSRWPKKIASMTDTTSLLSSMFISIGLHIVQVERKLQEVCTFREHCVFVIIHCNNRTYCFSYKKRPVYVHLLTYDVHKDGEMK